MSGLFQASGNDEKLMDICANCNKKETKMLEEMILAKYRRYMKVFLEEELHWLPKYKPWNHTIKLKEGAPEAIHAGVVEEKSDAHTKYS